LHSLVAFGWLADRVVLMPGCAPRCMQESDLFWDCRAARDHAPAPYLDVDEPVLAL
jgi:hypothetical protein